MDVVCDRFHFRHESRWSGRLGPAEGGGQLLCLACVIEMMESDDVSTVRKSFALSAVSGVLKCSPGALKEILQQDHRVSLRFISSLLGLFHAVEDSANLEKVGQVLLQLLLELQSELPFRFVLDEIHKQLSGQHSVKGFLATFNFLGSLVETFPTVARILVTQYVPLLEHLCSSLLYPDEGLKAASFNVWLKVFGTEAQAMPTSIRDRVCILLLQALDNASSLQLINNCIGLLWLLVQLGEAVSVLMSSPGSPIMCNESQNIQPLGQNLQHQSSDHCPLPLLMKKLLLSGKETLQVSSAKCIASVLAHSPHQYSTPFIKADVPDFLFDRLASSNMESLLWSAYTCLVLLTEDPLFFSQCHSIYGIESLVRSLNEALRLTNLEVPKQGLVLLTLILERQPPGLHLFPCGPGFVAVSEAVVAGVSTSCLLVATQAAKAACALFRLNHQSRPVQYKELQVLVEAVSNRLSELTSPSSCHRQSSGSLKKSDACSQASRSQGFLLQALDCFQAACRLAEECASDPDLKENPFTAPSKHRHAEDSLESLCQCVLHHCDSVWIPTVSKMCQDVPNAQILQYFYSILSSQFTLVPSFMPAFANKIASSGFYRLALEHKGLLCAGNRNPNLNESCCGFLQKLTMCLLTQSDPTSDSYQHDAEEVDSLLLYNLPSLCCRLSDWPSLLYETPGFQLCDYKGPRAIQYCVVIMLHLALQQGDRLLPDQTVFSSVVSMLHLMQEQGSCLQPHFVLRSALYLLAVTQDKSPSLDATSLNCISKALSSCQSFSSLYIHHPPLLHFICRYPELAEKFGSLVLELWLTRQAWGPDPKSTVEKAEKKGCGEEEQNKEQEQEITELLTLIEKYPAVMAILLDMVCTQETRLAERALRVLEVALCGQSDYAADLCNSLRPTLLQALQRHSMEDTEHDQGRVNSLPLVLKLLCVTQASDPPSSFSNSKRDGLHFKLLYYVSNIAGRIKPTNAESLLPAINYIYCCLNLSPVHCTDRAVAMLLSNSGLMDQLQTVLSSSFSSSSPPSLSSSTMLCCSHLLLSSLITLQRVHSAQVHKSISWSLDKVVQRLLIHKRNTDNLLLVSYLRLLQALLDVDLASPVLRVSTSPVLIGPRPLGVEDGALYPLGSGGAHLLSLVLSEFLLQKHEVILRASLNCLSSLLGFLQRKYSPAAKNLVCQLWSRFLAYCLCSSGQTTLLHPVTLRLVTLLLQHSGTTLLWEPDLLQVMETMEKMGVKELSQEAAQALRLLLTQVHQVQSSVLHPPLTDKYKQRVKSVMESLGPQVSAQSPDLHCNILRIGNMYICLTDLILKTN